MTVPCSKCFTIDVVTAEEAWVNSLLVIFADPMCNITPTFIDSDPTGQTFCNGCAASGGACYYDAVSPQPGLLCEGPGIFYGLSGASELTITCNYSCDITYSNVIVRPVIAWAGAPFTMNIASQSPYVLSPSSQLITTGFNSDIVLSVSPRSGVLLSKMGDIYGNCILPACSDFNLEFYLTPILTVA